MQQTTSPSYHLNSQTSLARVEGKAADVVDLADIVGMVDIADAVSAVQGYHHQYHCYQGACRCHHPVF